MRLKRCRLAIAPLAALVVGAIALDLGTPVSLAAPAAHQNHPVRFGYKITWYAVKACAPSKVIATLRLADARPSAWTPALHAMEGYDFDAEHTVLVAPIDGWTLAVGDKLGGSPNVDGETPLAPLAALSKACGDAQLYGSNRDHDWYLWSHAVNGKVVRAYEIDGSIGETLHDLGKRTREERGVNFLAPSENDVARIAGKWSIDPTKIDESQIVPQSYVARQP